MYNLNDVNCGPGPEYGKLTVTQGDSTATPKTPEIINSLMAITNPLDNYKRRGSMAEDKLLSPSEYTSADTCSSSTSSNVDSPTSPASIQSMCSQLIKEGLKLTLQKKRRNNLSSSENDSSSNTTNANLNQCPQSTMANFTPTRCDESSFDTEEDEAGSYGELNGIVIGLTPEDEERRRRRRERNKIAATKCRLKKRERTVNLVHESETLENQNQDLKSQIQELEVQRRRLMDMLTVHKPTCSKPSPEQSPIYDYQQPPSFLSSNNCPPPAPPSASIFTAKTDDQRRAVSTVCSETSILPDLSPLDTFDFQDAFVKNPSIMLSDSDAGANYLGGGDCSSTMKSKCSMPPPPPSFKCDNRNLPAQPSVRQHHINSSNTTLLNNGSYKCSTPSLMSNYGFLEDQSGGAPLHYDSISYSSMDNAGNGCIV